VTSGGKYELPVRGFYRCNEGRCLRSAKRGRAVMRENEEDRFYPPAAGGKVE